MSIGVLGTIRPADTALEDMSIYYTFTSNRQNKGDVMYSLNPSEVITYNYLPDTEGIVGNENLLEGLYNLKLSAAVFNQLGIYTIYIKPKSFSLAISDCNVLSSLPSVKGIVVNIADLPSKYQSNNSLQGHRIEYIGIDGKKVRNTIRYVVTSNKVVPVNENVGNTSQRSTRYRFDSNGSLVFLQLTPSSSSDIKPNVIPFIGNPGQTIIITNTYFTPLTIEVEMVENTIDTIANIIGGEQVKDVKNGILTYYDKDRVITKQFNLYEVKNDTGDVSLHEVKEKRTTIDDTQNFSNVISGL